ncbi:MAG: glycosyltransferase [Aliarcobacter sp.]|jgi:glycosyltransferase involved in cell wall biosynthesis|nr:glycosyltransferase [Aliarcobacter sp.]
MIKFLYRHNKDYSRFNIIKQFTKDLKIKNDIYILLPFSKNQFFHNFFKRDRIINDFFISNYDTYVFDRKKITKKNPRAWWKYFQDWFNFKFSKYLLSDTMAHFKYWEKLFGEFNGKHLVLPVLADKTIYYPSQIKNHTQKCKILFYGSFIPLHGIDVILKAFSIMEKNQKEFEATIIGAGQMYPKMKELFDSLDLKKVCMNGEFINENDLANIIREHDIILGIFGNSKKAKSVIPNKVYQSTACQKCTVTMKTDVISEFYLGKDLVTCENTPEDLAKTLIFLIENKNEIDIVSKNGYERFERIYDESKSKLNNFILEIDNKLS